MPWMAMCLSFTYQSTANALTNICQEFFTAYGVPEEISSNGGPQFTSTSFQNVCKQWKIQHWCSSVAYPQSNSRTGVAFKTSKRIIQENI